MHLSPRDEKGRVDVVGTALFFFISVKKKAVEVRIFHGLSCLFHACQRRTDPSLWLRHHQLIS